MERKVMIGFLIAGLVVGAISLFFGFSEAAAGAEMSEFVPPMRGAPSPLNVAPPPREIPVGKVVGVLALCLVLIVIVLGSGAFSSTRNGGRRTSRSEARYRYKAGRR